MYIYTSCTLYYYTTHVLLYVYYTIGDVDHLISCFLVANQINHGILLRKNAGLQYLYYLSQVHYILYYIVYHTIYYTTLLCCVILYSCVHCIKYSSIYYMLVTYMICNILYILFYYPSICTPYSIYLLRSGLL